MRHKTTSILLSVMCMGALMVSSNAPAATAKQQAAPSQAALAALGRIMFSDPALSGSGAQSCASCHAPGNAMMAPNALPVQLGGVALNAQGFRNVPTAMYALFSPPANISTNGKLKGGQLLDGRASTLAAQAALPFVAPNEMANASSADVKTKLLGRPYLSQFVAVFGSTVLNNADATLAAMAQAIAAFEQTDPSFQLFSSKFDAYLKGQVQLTAQEANGLSLFNNPLKGNCAQCHVSTGVNGNPALFTDFTYHAEGVPRNWGIAYNQDNVIPPAFVPQNGYGLGAPNHAYYDLGACGPFRTDLSGQTAFCGQFKVPTLRNTAIKGAYEHNGVFNSLQQVLSFYNTREILPGNFYKKADGTADIVYNDLPVLYAANVENPVPFHPLPGKLPHLQPSDISDIITFLCTLTDGFNPPSPSTYRYPAQCQAAVR
jgi:cytochrome c peroxidase